MTIIKLGIDTEMKDLIGHLAIQILADEEKMQEFIDGFHEAFPDWDFLRALRDKLSEVISENEEEV